jgi:CRP-like cAMP-binding protein
MALARVQAAAEHWVMVAAPAADMLRSTWFAATLSVHVLERLTQLGTTAEYETGTAVIREGEPCEALGVLVDGRMSIRLRLPGGEARSILTIEPGDVFGWSAILAPSIATSTVTAVTRTRTVVFEGARLLDAMTADQELAAAVHRRVLVAVARRLQATRVQLLDLYASSYDPW